MPPTCKTCQREDVDEINRQLVTNIPLRHIVTNYGGLSASGLQRHRETCLDELFAEVRESKRAGLLASVDEAKKEIKAVKTEFGDNGYIRLGLIGKMFDAIEKEAKLTGAYVKEGENPSTADDIKTNVIANLKSLGWSDDKIAQLTAKPLEQMLGAREVGDVPS